VFEAKRKNDRPSLVYCGDDERAKGAAAQLIGNVGFDAVDGGPLQIARYTEPFALLVAQLAYEGKAGRNWRIGSSGYKLRKELGSRSERFARRKDEVTTWQHSPDGRTSKLSSGHLLVR